jgi:hypothetical protein
VRRSPQRAPAAKRGLAREGECLGDARSHQSQTNALKTPKLADEKPSE